MKKLFIFSTMLLIISSTQCSKKITKQSAKNQQLDELYQASSGPLQLSDSIEKNKLVRGSIIQHMLKLQHSSNSEDQKIYKALHSLNFPTYQSLMHELAQPNLSTQRRTQLLLAVDGIGKILIELYQQHQHDRDACGQIINELKNLANATSNQSSVKSLLMDKNIKVLEYGKTMLLKAGIIVLSDVVFKVMEALMTNHEYDTLYTTLGIHEGKSNLDEFHQPFTDLYKALGMHVFSRIFPKWTAKESDQPATHQTDKPQTKPKVQKPADSKKLSSDSVDRSSSEKSIKPTEQSSEPQNTSWASRFADRIKTYFTRSTTTQHETPTRFEPVRG